MGGGGRGGERLSESPLGPDRPSIVPDVDTAGNKPWGSSGPGATGKTRESVTSRYPCIILKKPLLPVMGQAPQA